GQLNEDQQTPFGKVVNRGVCNQCQGTGKIIPDKCKTCHGTGSVKKNKEINIDIPAGIDYGQQIRVTGKGAPGVTADPEGDLFVVIQVISHEFLERECDSIYCELPVTFAQVALGDEIGVPTVYGKIKMKNAPGTQTGKVFRLKGKG